MKKYSIILFVPVLLLLTATLIQAEVKTIYFLYRTKAKGVLKLDCQKKRSGSGYVCYDQDGEEQDFPPGPEWRQVKVQDICFRHKVNDRMKEVKGCVQIEEPGQAPPIYVCQQAKENKLFLPGDKWEKISGDDSRCKDTPMKISDGIPRNGSTARPAQIEWR